MQENYNQHKIKVIISGGGTGGHIFPAIAIADTIKKANPDAEILFIGAKDKMEMQKVPAAGYTIEGLWISGLQRSLSLENLSFPFKLISSLSKAKKIIKKFKPDVVVGVGGFASGPTLWAATKKGIPTLIQEQNSFPGITNKILAKKVSKICVAYDGMEKFFPEEKIIMTGNPVRSNVIDLEGKETEAYQYFDLNPDKKTIFIVGGSQGALSINKVIHKNIGLFIENEFQLLWQTGNYYYDTAKSAVKDLESKGIKVVEFIDRMDFAYSVADIIISRAGAIAVSEISCVGKPAVFIPLPTAAEDHQRKNAMALVEKDAAIMIPDQQAENEFKEVFISLINNEKKQEALKQNLNKLAIKDAADRIVDEIIKLIS